MRRTLGEEIAWWAGVLGASAASVGFVYWAAKPAKGKAKAVKSDHDRPRWPIDFEKLTRIGDAVLPDRHGRPHKGRDLFAPAGTLVRAVVPGEVLRVRIPSDAKELRFVDVRGRDGRIYRYLHLGRIEEAVQKPGARVASGDVIGTVAPTGTSGVLRSPPHLHFEVRKSDWDPNRGKDGDYGEPIEPLTLLRRERKARA